MLAGRSIKTLESVLELAVWLEKHGQEFYAAAMVETDDVELETLFAYLMEEEKQHCALYTRLFEQQTEKSAGEKPLLGEYAHFIDLLIREITANLIIEDEISPKKLLFKALRFEKDTLLYFNEIRDLFDDDSAAIIDSICREEKRHIRQLMERGEKMQLFMFS
jgi:rubrerythrin